MAKHLSVRQAVRLALLVSATPAVLTSPAFAQEQDASDSMDEVVVTGSRIVSPNLQSISPITAIGAEELNIAGKTRIEDVLNQLPQAFAAQGSNISNASDGTASVDLRGLGVNRTLTLVNGKRLMPGDPDGGSAADLNQIPLTLVKRVDVLTGGASSVYGADAVAGVVNFVMDNEFEGVRLDANYSFYNHKNDNERTQDLNEARNFPLPDSSVNVGYAKEYSIAVGIGGAEGRGHATFYATYREVDAVLQDQFDYSSCTLNLAAARHRLRLRWLGHGGSGAVLHQIVPASPPIERAGDAAAPGRTTAVRPRQVHDRCGWHPASVHGRRSVQLRSGELLPASGRALHRWRVRQLQVERCRRRVRRVHVHGRPFGGADRPLGRVPRRRNVRRELQQPVLVARNPIAQAERFCGAVRPRIPASPRPISARCSSAAATRKVAAARTTSVTSRIAWWSGVRGDINDVLSYDGYYLHGETKRNSTYLNDFSTRRTALALNAVDDGDWKHRLPGQRGCRSGQRRRRTACRGTSGRPVA